jgi:eukaryotic-like serine/threonine-protein kinase
MNDASASARAAFRWGTTPEAAEARRLLAERVALYARLLASVFGGLYVFGALVTVLLSPEMFLVVHAHPAKWVNLALVFVGIFCFWLARRPELPESVVLLVDAGLPFTINLLVAAALPGAPHGYGLQFVPILILVLALILRAALVPSPALRTAMIGAAASLPTVLTEYHSSIGDTTLPPFFSPSLMALGTTMWCVAVTLSTALVSREIYGLRHEIAQARRLGQYTLERLIGEGGMGSVYTARHALLRRPTAIKLLSAERAGPENIARFEREVQLTSALTHPNTVAVYDYGRTPDGTFYYAMEYIAGLSLEQLVQRHGPQPPARVVHILLQAVDALAEAHDVGLVHRDVKPANILLCRRGGRSDVVKLVDFGLVKDIGQGNSPALSRAQTLAGTPLYIAPESITDPEHIDHRVDIYGLGAVGYYLLTGSPPFAGKSVVEICSHHLHTLPTPPSQRLGRTVPEALERLLLACLAKKPGERPESARALYGELQRIAAELGWSESDAQAWWQAHGPQLEPTKS